MADYFPLIANPVGNLITELPANNNLNLANSSIINAVSIQSVGNVTGTYFIGNGSLLTGIDATSIQNGTSNVVVAPLGSVNTSINGELISFVNSTGVTVLGLVSATGNVVGGNLVTAGLISATGTITGSQFNGSGAGLTSIPGANVTGAVANAAFADSAYSAFAAASAIDASRVTANAQPNITSVGILTSLSVTGNITGGNITISTDTIRSAGSTITIDPSADGATGLVVIAGNLQVTGTTTTIDSTTVTVNDLMINVANNAATSAAANGGGLGVGPVGTEYVKLYWDSAGNTWDSTHGISAAGTVTATSFSGSGTGLTSITGANVSGTVANATFATTAGTVTTAAQPNITSVGTLSSVSITGNTTSGNFIGILNGSGANVTSISATNISSGTLDQARLANASLTVNGTAIALGGSATITATATGTLTIGTGLGGTSYNGSTGVTITNTGVTSLTGGGGITVNAATGGITLGSTATSANTAGAIVARGASGEFSAGVITAIATQARYADLAEKYTADADYEPGTVLIFGGEQEVTASTADAQPQVVGVVSTNPAYVMNSELEHKFVATVALTGRTPVKVIGPVRKGDFVVSAANGHACASAEPKLGTVIGKAIESFDGATGVIEVLINNH